MSKISVEAKVLEQTIRDEIEGLLKGAQEDVAVTVNQITSRLVAAVALGREDLRDELLAQLKVLAAHNKVKASKAGWTVISSVVSTLFRILILLPK